MFFVVKRTPRIILHVVRTYRLQDTHRREENILIYKNAAREKSTKNDKNERKMNDITVLSDLNQPQHT